jgi:predicted nucleic acid-binding protein
LYGEIAIPEGVWKELNALEKQWPGAKDVEAASWIRRHAVKNLSLVAVLRRDLDPGEAESIALALELGADLILLDEKEGRRAAQRLGLQVMGVVGILIAAKAEHKVDLIQPYLNALRQLAGFYVSHELYQEALIRAKEPTES